MPYELYFASEAEETLRELERMDAQKLKKVRRALGLLSLNPRHPGLNSHKMVSVKAPGNKPVWESYVENSTPSAWRIFWHYGKEPGAITIFRISAHP